MSALCGLFHADGSPAEEWLLAKMRDAAACRGPDGAGLWLGEGMGLGHRLLWNSEESVGERQPVSDSRGLWITADCRVDNREELREQFSAEALWTELVRAAGTSTPPDVFYLLGAYRLWGVEAPARLLGDFAFALWDGPRRRLFCARDPIGMKPFVYQWDGKRFLFGSETKQIFQDPGVSTALHLPHLAEWLV